MMSSTNHDENKRPLYEPIIVEKVDPSVLALQKSPEDKDYYVLYYNREFEEYRWKKFTGRYDAYFGIKDILDTESIDIRNSIVIVETVGVDPSTNKGKAYLNHPDNSSNILQFCHYVEKFFGNNAYNVDEYDTGELDAEDESTEVEEKIKDSMRSKFMDNDAINFSNELLSNQRQLGYFNPIITGEDSQEV